MTAFLVDPPPTLGLEPGLPTVPVGFLLSTLIMSDFVEAAFTSTLKPNFHVN